MCFRDGGCNRHFSIMFFSYFFFLIADFLFCGTAGTGKTLVACALANECSQGNGIVIFFMRNGVNCLSEWVGEYE